MFGGHLLDDGPSDFLTGHPDQSPRREWLTLVNEPGPVLSVGTFDGPKALPEYLLPPSHMCA